MVHPSTMPPPRSRSFPGLSVGGWWTKITLHQCICQGAPPVANWGRPGPFWPRDPACERRNPGPLAPLPNALMHPPYLDGHPDARCMAPHQNSKQAPPSAIVFEIVLLALSRCTNIFYLHSFHALCRACSGVVIFVAFFLNLGTMSVRACARVCTCVWEAEYN